MSRVEQARDAYTQAVNASYLLRQEVEAALRATRESFRERLEAASRAEVEAKRALLQAENEAAPFHEWNGKKVYRDEIERARWTGKEIGRRRVEGIVETYRHGVDLGPGYKSLNPGDPYVRLIKKDGTLGKKTEAFRDWRGDVWTLADETAPQ